jgi:hypothetical protein
VLARLDAGHSRTDLLDDAGAFVAEHTRQRHGEILVAAHQVGVTDTDTGNLHDNFIGPRLAQLQRLDVERPALFSNHRCFDFHCCSKLMCN